jgi:thiamine pyrophosphate-dependent acetolactate synthase large subunit-like protein
VRTFDCYTLLASLHTNQAVVCHLGSNTKEWHRINGDRDNSFHMHSMGMASSFGLGLALALPQTPVWILDSDGGICINLGAVLTEAQFQPPNLLHVIVSNRRYVTIDGPSVVNHDRTDYAAILRGAGIANVHEFREYGDFERDIAGIVGSGEHAFVVLEVEAEMEVRPQVPYEGPEIKYRFARHMERQEGVAVLGPLGY